MGCSLRQMSIGNETSKSARTCSVGTKRCGEGPLPVGAVCVSSLACCSESAASLFGAAALDALPGSASAAALSAASACSAMLCFDASLLESLLEAWSLPALASLVSVLGVPLLAASVFAASVFA